MCSSFGGLGYLGPRRLGIKGFRCWDSGFGVWGSPGAFNLHKGHIMTALCRILGLPK